MSTALSAALPQHVWSPHPSIHCCPSSVRHSDAVGTKGRGAALENRAELPLARDLRMQEKVLL